MVDIGAVDVPSDAIVEAVVVVVDVEVAVVVAQTPRLVSDPVRLCRVVAKIWRLNNITIMVGKRWRGSKRAFVACRSHT